MDNSLKQNPKFFFLMDSSFTIPSFIEHLNILKIIQMILKNGLCEQQPGVNVLLESPTHWESVISDSKYNEQYLQIGWLRLVSFEFLLSYHYNRQMKEEKILIWLLDLCLGLPWLALRRGRQKNPTQG